MTILVLILLALVVAFVTADMIKCLIDFVIAPFRDPRLFIVYGVVVGIIVYLANK